MGARLENEGFGWQEKALIFDVTCPFQSRNK